MNYFLLLAWYIANATGTWPEQPYPYALSQSKVEIIDIPAQTNQVEVVAGGVTNYVMQIAPAVTHWEDRLAITRWDVPEVAQPDLAAYTTNDMALAQAAYEAHRQGKKNAKQKSVENKYFELCDALAGTTGHTNKLTFEQIDTLINALPSENQQFRYSLRFLAIDAEAKRELGLNWWDDAKYH